MKKPTFRCALAFSACIAILLSGCGQAGTESSTPGSASASGISSELVIEVPDLAILQGSNVNVAELASALIPQAEFVEADTQLLNLSIPGQVLVLYTIQQNGTTSEHSAKVYVVAESEAPSFQAKHPDIPLYISNTERYTAQRTSVPASENETGSQDGIAEPDDTNIGQAEPTQVSKPADTAGGSTRGKTASNTGTDTANSNTGSETGGNTGSKPSGNTSTNTGTTTTSQKPSGSTGGTTTGTNPDINTGTGNTGTPTVGGTTGTKPGGNTGQEKPSHTHDWQPVYETIHHDEVGHYETQTVSDAWDEPIYESRAICNLCGADVTSDAAYAEHMVSAGHSSYTVKKVQVGTTHHDTVTEQVWVVDQAAYDEQVIVGYRCSCGATK